MASLDFMKCTKAKAGGLKVHLDQHCREELNHSNKHIQQDLSHLNYTIGTTSFDESYNRMLERTREVDAQQPPKRVKQDRVICDMCYIVCPQEIEDHQQEFFQKAYEFLENKFGKENIHGMFVHLDEKHEYRDSRVRDADDRQTVKESLYHSHVMISPYTQEYGINSKAFNTKEMFTNVQKEFNNYVYQEYGINYHTKEQSLHLEVEVLKEASELLEQKELRIAELELQLTETKVLLDNALDTIDQSEELVHHAQQIIENFQDVEIPNVTRNQYFPCNAFPKKEFKENVLNPFEKPKQYYEVESVKEFISNAENTASERDLVISDNKYLQKQNEVLKDLENRLLKVDSLKENKELHLKLEKVENECNKYKRYYNQEYQSHEYTKQQLEQSQNTVKWYESFYNKALDFMNNLTMNNSPLVNKFIELFDRNEDRRIISKDVDDINYEKKYQSYDRGLHL